MRSEGNDARRPLFRRHSRTLAQATKPPSASERRQDHTMKINDTANRRELNHLGLGLGLTEAEARELRDALTTLLKDSGERHEHVSSSDRQRQLTVWLVRD